jgi:hypothetical protein
MTTTIEFLQELLGRRCDASRIPIDESACSSELFRAADKLPLGGDVTLVKKDNCDLDEIIECTRDHGFPDWGAPVKRRLYDVYHTWLAAEWKAGHEDEETFLAMATVAAAKGLHGSGDHLSNRSTDQISTRSTAPAESDDGDEDHKELDEEESSLSDPWSDDDVDDPSMAHWQPDTNEERSEDETVKLPTDPLHRLPREIRPERLNRSSLKEQFAPEDSKMEAIESETLALLRAPIPSGIQGDLDESRPSSSGKV